MQLWGGWIGCWCLDWHSGARVKMKQLHSRARKQVFHLFLRCFFAFTNQNQAETGCFTQCPYEKKKTIKILSCGFRWIQYLKRHCFLTTEVKMETFGKSFPTQFIVHSMPQHPPQQSVTFVEMWRLNWICSSIMMDVTATLSDYSTNGG